MYAHIYTRGGTGDVVMNSKSLPAHEKTLWAVSKQVMG